MGIVFYDHGNMIDRKIVATKLIRICVIISGIMCYIYYGIYKMIFVHFDILGGDFLKGYLAAKNFLDGRPLYLMPENCNPYFYPPISTFLFLPFAFLKQNHAVFLWFIMNHAIIIMSCWLIFSTHKNENWKNSALAALSTICFSFPLYGNMQTGNINIMIFFCIIAIYYFLFANKQIYVPFLVSAATFFKIYPVLLIVIFIRNKQYQSVKHFILSVLLIGLISLLIFGSDIHINYLYALSRGIDFVGIFPAMSFVYVTNIVFPELNKAIISLMNAFIGIVLLSVWWFRSQQSIPKERSVSNSVLDLFIITVVVVILFPSSWLFYHALFIFPFYYILFVWLQGRTRLIWFPSFLIIFFLISFWEPIIYHFPLSVDGLTIKTIGQNKDKFPILYPLFYSCPFIFNCTFFVWLSQNYDRISQSLKTTHQNESSMVRA
jgi:hypothetical protein